MKPKRIQMLPKLLIVAGGLALVCGAGTARAAVSVGLTPAQQTVTPGTDFDVFVDVTASGSAFNGFDAVVSYDPAALTFLPLSPTTTQQGCLMTGACSAACGSTFHRFTGAADSLSVSDVLLCNGVALTGPGHLYKLRFHASTTQQVTHLSIRHATFYDAGLFVPVAGGNGADVGIGVSLAVGPGTTGLGAVVRAEPNPSFGRVGFVADGVAAPATIVVVDLLGRAVCTLGPAPLGGGARLEWDGRDATGARVPAGIYHARIRRNGVEQVTRVVRLP